MQSVFIQIPETSHADNRGRPFIWQRRWLLPVVLMLLAACSGGASRDEKDQEESEEVSAVQPAGGNNEQVAEVDTPPATSDEVDDENDPDKIIRRLDRVIRGADAYILRTGLSADAALSSQSLDALEGRMRSAQAELQEMRARD